MERLKALQVAQLALGGLDFHRGEVLALTLAPSSAAATSRKRTKGPMLRPPCLVSSRRYVLASWYVKLKLVEADDGGIITCVSMHAAEKLAKGRKKR